MTKTRSYHSRFTQSDPDKEGHVAHFLRISTARLGKNLIFNTLFWNY